MNRHRDNKDVDKDAGLTPVDEADDKAWELLLEARKVEPGPFFARNVLREIRLQKAGQAGRDAPGWRSLFTLPRLAFGAAAAAAVITLLVLIPGGSPENAPIARNPAAPSPELISNPAATPESPVDDSEGFDMGDYQEEIATIDYFDDLLAVQDVTALDDAALSELLF